LEVWGEIVLGAMKEGGFENAAERLKRQAAKELESIRGRKAIYEYLIEDFVPVCAAGYMNWYQKKLEGRS
jgi:hypothetical protein